MERTKLAWRRLVRSFWMLRAYTHADKAANCLARIGEDDAELRQRLVLLTFPQPDSAFQAQQAPE